MSRPTEVEQWSDQDVYYWVFEVNIGEQHANALWYAEVTGEMLLSLKKSQLYEHCKDLSKDTTNNLWREIQKLQKSNRKSIFRHKSKPSPVAPDYPDDDDFDSDFSDEEVDGDPDDPTAESLPERLKARLKIFQEQQQQQQTQEQDNDTMEEYIVPDDHNDSDGPQDAYEEFDHDDGQPDQDELYLTPPDETNEGPELPPPLPSRQPIGPSSGDTNPNLAPVLPPRPGAQQSIPKYQPSAPSIPKFQHTAAPLIAEDSEEEYVVPSSQVDQRQPQPVQPAEDHDQFYEPPNEPSTDTDFGEEYIVPNSVPMPKPPSGRRSPVNPSLSRTPKPKPPLPTNPNSVGKATDVGRRPPAPLPNDSTGKHTGNTSSTSQSTDSSTTSNNITNRLPGHTSNNTNSVSKLTGSQSFRDRMGMFQKQPAPTPKPPLPKPGGSLHQIKKGLDKHSSHPRRATTIPVFCPDPPKPAPEPVRPVVPRQKQSTDKNDLSNCEWFREDVGRDEVTSALLTHRVDGAFLVRPSGRKPDFPYTLQLLYKGKVKNLPIGKRLDKKFALGAPKDGETRFDSVWELIDYHKRQEVVLAKDEGKTCLMEPVPLP